MEGKEFDDDYVDSTSIGGGQMVDTTTQPQSALRSMKSAHRRMTVLRCKVIMVGDAHVGKTALCQMLHSNGQNYPKNYLMTLGVDFSVKEVAVKGKDRVVEMYMYDTGGQSVFNQRELGGQYWTNASVCIFAYDAGSRKSFLSCSKWLAAVRSENQGRPVPGLLVANKVDLRERGRIEVSKEEGQQFAKENGLTFFETSALRNTGIQEIFDFIANAYSEKYDEAINKIHDFV